MRDNMNMIILLLKRLAFMLYIIQKCTKCSKIDFSFRKMRQPEWFVTVSYHWFQKAGLRCELSDHCFLLPPNWSAVLVPPILSKPSQASLNRSLAHRSKQCVRYDTIDKRFNPFTSSATCSIFPSFFLMCRIPVWWWWERWFVLFFDIASFSWWWVLEKK